MSPKNFSALLFSLFLSLSPTLALACPMCAGLSTAEKNKITVAVLIGFLFLMYIPFIIIYRCIKKYSQFEKKMVEQP